MWPALFVLTLLAGLLGHLWWRRRAAALQASLVSRDAELRSLAENHRREVDQITAQQEALFNSVVQGVLLLDPQGRVRMANRALVRLFGSENDLRGRTVIEALRHHQIQELAHRLRDEGCPVTEEIDLPGPPARHVEVTGTTVTDREGCRHGMVLMFQDLTRLKQLEETRREFVANVSHELRTPLSMIKGYVETLIDGAKDDPAVLTRFLETIRKHSDRLTFLIEDLLTLSSLESGALALNLRPVDLKGLVDETLEDLKSLAAERRVSLRNQVQAPLLVQADSDRLGQVLHNLLDNALKYGRSPGQIEIAALARENGQVEVRVQDDGPGIPPEAVERIFERFYRVDRARSRNQGGTGLGLAIVKHIVQSHGGEVWARSVPGEGATFHFTLKVAESTGQLSGHTER